jgi:hypothetical protein
MKRQEREGIVKMLKSAIEIAKIVGIEPDKLKAMEYQYSLVSKRECLFNELEDLAEKSSKKDFGTNEGLKRALEIKKDIVKINNLIENQIIDVMLNKNKQSESINEEPANEEPANEEPANGEVIFKVVAKSKKDGCDVEVEMSKITKEQVLGILKDIADSINERY